MKRILTFIFSCIVAVPVYGAFGGKTVWWVATTGADTNGGAFDAGVGSPGTDESGTATAITITTTGTTTGTGSPAFSATTHGPGNFVHIASGTGCTTGWHELTSQAVGVGTFESAIADMTGRTCVGTIGGNLLTLAQLATNIAIVGTSIACVKSGTYQISTGVTFASTVHLQGYTSTCGVNGVNGDMGKPLIQITAAGLTAITLNGSVSSIANFQFDANGQTGTTWAVLSSVNQITASNILTSGFATGWKQGGGSGLTIWNSRFHGGPAGCGDGVGTAGTSGTTLIGVLSDHNACNGIGIDGSFVCINSVSADNTGISSGFSINNPANAMVILGCGAYNNQTDGFSFTSTQAVFGTLILNTWAWGNGSGKSFNSAAGATNTYAFDYNAYASGTLANITLQLPTGHNVTLTVDPTVGCGNATPNCALNSTAGGGLLLNQTGFPSALVSYLGAGYASVGPLVPQFGPTGAGGGAYGFVQ